MGRTGAGNHSQDRDGESISNGAKLWAMEKGYFKEVGIKLDD